LPFVLYKLDIVSFTTDKFNIELVNNTFNEPVVIPTFALIDSIVLLFAIKFPNVEDPLIFTSFKILVPLIVIDPDVILVEIIEFKVAFIPRILFNLVLPVIVRLLQVIKFNLLSPVTKRLPIVSIFVNAFPNVLFNTFSVVRDKIPLDKIKLDAVILLAIKFTVVVFNTVLFDTCKLDVVIPELINNDPNVPFDAIIFVKLLFPSTLIEPLVILFAIKIPIVPVFVINLSNIDNPVIFIELAVKLVINVFENVASLACKNPNIDIPVTFKLLIVPDDINALDNVELPLIIRDCKDKVELNDKLLVDIVVTCKFVILLFPIDAKFVFKFEIELLTLVKLDMFPKLEYKLPLIPIPPAIINAPVVIPLEIVVDIILIPPYVIIEPDDELLASDESNITIF